MKKKTQPRKGSKLFKLLEYLKTHTRVTADDIYEALHIHCYTSLIHSLRHQYGFDIDCELVRNPDGTRHGVYTLVQ